MTQQLSVPVAQLDKLFVNDTLTDLDEYLVSRSLLHEQADDYTVRETLHFGYDYFALLNDDKTFTPIPTFLQELCARCMDVLGSDYHLGSHQDYSNVIVSIYHEGYRLRPHVDVEPTENENFYFGEYVIGVILESDSEGHLYVVKAQDEADAVDKKPLWVLAETAGTVFLLAGAARCHPYFHGVTTVKKLRISVTFRTVMFK